MEFVGLLLCIVTLYILYSKISFIVKGEVVEGKVVGYDYASKGLYGIRGYNYRIRIEYEENVYIAKSLESVVTSGGYPTKDIGNYYKVYFNPAFPKRVSIKGKTGIMWLTFFVFIVGLIVFLSPYIIPNQSTINCTLIPCQ
ncbi:MAG TPA: DUF3592 domain-containing protein [Candidatus Dormibacteraeota bacterium]|nr:DUF3592 domain-containing protein [Candidatus Dormibacteraeota bacterium]